LSALHFQSFARYALAWRLEEKKSHVEAPEECYFCMTVDTFTDRASSRARLSQRIV